jgi:hypothetical protein
LSIPATTKNAQLPWLKIPFREDEMDYAKKLETVEEQISVAESPRAFSDSSPTLRANFSNEKPVTDQLKVFKETVKEKQ